jgi:predicted amidophosphoribosyltransferase
MKTCPDCREDIPSEASVCKHCGRRFAQAEVASATRRTIAGRRIGIFVVVAFCALLAYLMR